ncbi:MAG: hypothetical protein JSS02_07550 [Planctomycetes bacterium]|nr:hypothetical protein [Planctomycetota bacterium]
MIHLESKLFKGLKWALLLAATSVAAVDVQAGLFEFKKTTTKAPPKSKPAAKTAASPIRQASASVPAPEPGPITPIPQSSEVPNGYPEGGYGESQVCYPAMRMHREKTFDCFNCGDEDRCQHCVRHNRKKFDSSWYPRVAPYCIAGWGYTQPCWRRTQDNYNCPPQTMPRSSVPARYEDPPALEAAPEDSTGPEENPVPEDLPVRKAE